MLKLPEIDFDKLSRKKWVAYFDLLGSKDREALELYEIYRTCLQEAEWNTHQIDVVQITYFSDTFLLFTPDDSKKSLNSIDMAARGFFDDLIDRDIPVRGGMACNEFYPDNANGIYLGKALVEAHEIGEKYNWLGFVLHQSALDAMAKTGRTATDRGHYKKWNAEFRNKPGSTFCNEEVTAYFSLNNLENLKSLARQVEDEYKEKYFNSIAFLESAVA
jgi:hypothetical protein